jgi:hypothetical protein
MAGAAAVRVAIDLVHVPSRVRLFRAEPLPDDVETVLRIAAGDEAAEAAAAAAVGRPRELVRKASAFFIEQILLCPDADSYRVLGADEAATAAELRRNMALLLKWLHPDMDRHGVRSLFAGRVTQAWETLKTPERRAAYDQRQAVRAAQTCAGLPLRCLASRAQGIPAARHVAAVGCALLRTCDPCTRAVPHSASS